MASGDAATVFFRSRASLGIASLRNCIATTVSIRDGSSRVLKPLPLMNMDATASTMAPIADRNQDEPEQRAHASILPRFGRADGSRELSGNLSAPADVGVAGFAAGRLYLSNQASR